MVVAGVAFAVNLLIHLLVFRAGWTIRVYVDNVQVRKLRYRSKKQALADLDNQRTLAGDLL